MDIMFQFLIGWLQTNKSAESTCKCYGVSIPYRLATNTVHSREPHNSMGSFNSLQVGYKHRGAGKTPFYDEVSIPYRLATNGSSGFAYHEEMQGFNSLQVGYKQVFPQSLYGDKRVSIPYRLATNRYFLRVSTGINEFQFLIGWLQTKTFYPPQFYFV